jgi:hypothetical protein
MTSIQRQRYERDGKHGNYQLFQNLFVIDRDVMEGADFQLTEHQVGVAVTIIHFSQDFCGNWDCLIGHLTS